jgi:hypothetical protein
MRPVCTGALDDSNDVHPADKDKELAEPPAGEAQPGPARSTAARPARAEPPESTCRCVAAPAQQIGVLGAFNSQRILAAEAE